MDGLTYQDGVMDAEKAATDALIGANQRGKISRQVRDFLIDHITDAIHRARKDSLPRPD